MECALCRRPVSLIVANLNENRPRFVRDWLRVIDRYNAQFAVREGFFSDFADIFRNRSFLFRVLRAIVSRQGIAALVVMLRGHNKSVLMLAGLFFYIVSPFDLLPEAFLGPIGLVDDFAAMIMIGGVLKDVMSGLLLQRAR